jgi:hypothetical protein
MAKIGIDFDGCCIVALPEVGWCDIETGAAEVLGKLVKKGHELYLWTCRNNDPGNPYNWTNGELRAETSLQEAVRWFNERDIPLSGINEVEDEEKKVGKARKILVDLLIDDTSLGSKYTVGDVEYVSYDTGEIKTCRTYSLDWEWVEKELIELGLL